MSDDRRKQQPITRRQFVQRGAVATAAVLLTGCVGEGLQEEAAPTPTQALAQRQATETPRLPTATAEPSATATQAVVVSEEATSAPTEEATLVPTEAATLEPTPPCDDDDEETIAQTEGPYFTPNSPKRTSLLEPGISGTKLVITGYVLSTNCQPVARALIDFWQADDNGQYDNVGYRLRGHQFTDEQGRYTLETVVPGLYPGRTRHLHVKVQAPNGAVLTTQQYFPDEPDNTRDGIFHPALVMAVQDTADGRAASFNYVLDVA
ncbi:MAG TPA: twin-arginine translocation signal domain-containing protein [Ardenticatenaceae bacterium]|jgi:protocatechuate 3,4-dioxygenase beta subunit